MKRTIRVGERVAALKRHLLAKRTAEVQGIPWRQVLRLAACGLLMLAGQAAQALTPGDVVVIGYDCDGSTAPDQVSLLFLADVPAGTVFFGRDDEITADGATTWSDAIEATYKFTAVQAIAKGTVIYGLEWNSGSGNSSAQYTWAIVNGSGPGLGGSGDSFYLYQTAEGTWNGATPTFLFGYNNQSDSSPRAGGLTVGTTWLDFTDADICSYKTSGATYSGTKAELLTALGTAGNWNFQASSAVLPTSGYSFSVTGGAAALSVAVTNPATATMTVPNATDAYDVAGTSANAVGFLSWSNGLTHASGAVAAAAEWSVAGLDLEVGVNVISMTASNATGEVVSDTVTVIRQAAPSADTLRIGVFSDPHLFATNLLVNDGTAFQAYLAQDRKLIAESAAITHAVVDQIIAQNPDVVFVVGDLTKDGEYDSHVAFSNELSRLEAAGAQVLVIPGNHDIDNPHAVAYDGATTQPVPSVSPAEFKAIYGPFGYDVAAATDPDSVGYAVQLTPTLAVICMDSTQYGNRTYGSFTNGNRLAWITNQVVTARAAGSEVIGLMHHGLLEHFPGQKQLFSEYVLDGYETVAPLFAGLGLKAVFTGHFHANDIVQATFGGHTLYDIETGSTVTYPCPFRMLELHGDGTLDITTDTVKAIDYDLGGAADFPTYAYDYLNSGMLLLSQGMLMAPPYSLDAGTAGYVAPAVTEALMHHYAGDEPGLSGATPATQGIVMTLLGGDPLSVMLGQAIYSILTDTEPSDTAIALDLTPPTLAITAPTAGASFAAEAASASVSIAPTECVGAYLYANTTMGVTLSTSATSATLPLQPGENQLVVSGTNALGWVAAATVTVTRASLSDRQLTLGVSSSLAVPNAEIVAFDAATQRAFVTCIDQGIQIIDLSSPFAPKMIGTVLQGELVNSVAVKNGVVAAAVENAVRSNPGEVVFMDADGTVLKRVAVGIQPDMVTFTPDGGKVLTADEAETGDHADYGAGSVSVIDLSDGVAGATATVLGFGAFDSQTNALIAAGVRLFPGRLPSVDFEPEFIAVAPDGQTAMVTLQENNALAKIDLNALVITAIVPLGLKDHSLPGNGLDASDRDGPSVTITNWPVFGMYMPDAVASYQVAGQTYFVTANEGDVRDTGTDEARISSLALDAAEFPNAATLKQDANLGRLTASAIDGDVDKDGDIDTLHTYGARSFSIWGAAGNLVFDSGDALARITAEATPTLFNANDGLTSKVDQRSDDKGCEPEGVETATIGGCTYAFVALERAGGGIMAYDVTAPAAPVFVQYARRDGDVAPEGVKFVPAAESPSGKALLLVANETSQTLTVYEIETGGHVRVLSSDTTVSSSEPTYAVSGTAGDVAALTWHNAQSGATGTVAVAGGSWNASVPLDYGINVLTFSGTTAEGLAFTDTVTVTREAPTPANGEDVEAAWDYAAATGAVHVAWSRDDWYQFQSTNVCWPGTYLFRDLYGGATVPGEAGPEALTFGAAGFRYDAQDATRSVVLTADGDFSITVPCYTNVPSGVPLSQEVWVRVAYWNDPANPGWVQGWSLGATAVDGTASAPVLMGRATSAEGLITEAYALTLTSGSSSFALSFSTESGLSSHAPAYIDAIEVDVLGHAPLLLDGGLDGTVVGSGTDTLELSVRTEGLTGELVFRNTTTGWASALPNGTLAAAVPLAYGINVLTVSGTDASGATVTATVTVTRAAPTPANGAEISPDWDYLTATGAVHVAWTTNDWYQFQSTNACLPGAFLFRDAAGGNAEPGVGDPLAATLGASLFRYDALDGVRCMVVETNGDFQVRVPCYNVATLGDHRTHDVRFNVSYWDAHDNPSWVQGWVLAVTPEQGVASEPALMGRVRSEAGVITESYGFAITGAASSFSVALSASPALASANAAYVSAITVDTRVTSPLVITVPEDGTTVDSATERTTVSMNTTGLEGALTLYNTATGETLTVPAGTGTASLALAYGANRILITGTDGQGRAVTAAVTMTREAPTPASGVEISPDWDYLTATGAVHVAWTTNDWYQFQSTNACLPGTFLFRDTAGGNAEPGDGDPRAATLGASLFRYDALDGVRCMAVETNGDFSVRVPCYASGLAEAPLAQRVWVRVSYWGESANPEWVQGWEPSVLVEGALSGASVPQLMGRQRGEDGLITEAYAFTVTGDVTAFTVNFQAGPALSARNQAFIDGVTVDALSVPARVVRTTVEGGGNATPALTHVLSGETATVSVTAAAWHRILTLTTNGVEVADAAGQNSFTLTFAAVAGSISNNVVFAYRADVQNPALGEGRHVPTAWLAQFGRGEAEPFVTGDRPVADKYLLNLNPYQTADVLFDIETFTVGVDGVQATVRLLVDGQGHPAVNGTLQLEGKAELGDDWVPVSGTALNGATFTNGRRQYSEFPATGYRFFRVTVR